MVRSADERGAVMKLTVWGARGSIPVSGPEFDRYGGDTTCVCLETAAGDTGLLPGRPEYRTGNLAKTAFIALRNRVVLF